VLKVKRPRSLKPGSEPWRDAGLEDRRDADNLPACPITDVSVNFPDSFVLWRVEGPDTVDVIGAASHCRGGDAPLLATRRRCNGWNYQASSRMARGKSEEAIKAQDQIAQGEKEQAKAEEVTSFGTSAASS